MLYEVSDDCLSSVLKRGIGLFKIPQGVNPHIEKPDVAFYESITSIQSGGKRIDDVQVRLLRFHSIDGENVIRLVDGVRTVTSPRQPHGSARQTLLDNWDKIYGNLDSLKNFWCIMVQLPQ